LAVCDHGLGLFIQASWLFNIFPKRIGEITGIVSRIYVKIDSQWIERPILGHHDGSLKGRFLILQETRSNLAVKITMQPGTDQKTQ